LVYPSATPFLGAGDAFRNFLSGRQQGQVTDVASCVYLTHRLVNLAGGYRMAGLEQAQIEDKNFINRELEDFELPLQRIYACEKTCTSQLLLTQPLHGSVLEQHFAPHFKDWKSRQQKVIWLEAPAGETQ
jgi:hypothetical protein